MWQLPFCQLVIYGKDRPPKKKSKRSKPEVESPKQQAESQKQEEEKAQSGSREEKADSSRRYSQQPKAEGQNKNRTNGKRYILVECQISHGETKALP